MKKIKKLVCVGVLATLGLNGMATTIYDNYSSFNNFSFSLGNGQEVGNQITINNPGLWSLTNFSFEYFTPSYNLDPSVAVDVRFYYNNGSITNGFASPGGKFWDSGWFNNTIGLPGTNGYPVIGGGSYHSVDYSAAGGDFSSLLVNLPGTFTFTITFTNLGGLNIVDLPLANNISNSLAYGYGDYWLNNGGVWTLMTNANSAANLIVDFSGVPEPTTFGLAALGGAVLLGAAKLRRKRG